MIIIVKTALIWLEELIICDIIVYFNEYLIIGQMAQLVNVLDEHLRPTNCETSAD